MEPSSSSTPQSTIAIHDHNHDCQSPSVSGEAMNDTVPVRKRSQSGSRTPTSPHTSEASQEQLRIQQNEPSQLQTAFIDGERENQPLGNSTFMSSPELHNTETLEASGNKKRKWYPWMIEIIPGLWLGNIRASINSTMLRENHIGALVSLYDCPRAEWGLVFSEAGIPRDSQIFIRCEDSPTLDLLVYLSDICDFIDLMASTSGPVLVHCEVGRSRSTAVIVAYLMRKYHYKYEDALELVREKTKGQRKVKPREGLVRQLRIWDEVGYNVWEDDKMNPKAPYQEYLADRVIQMGSERDSDAFMNALRAHSARYPIGPKLVPPYCCRLTNECPCNTPSLADFIKNELGPPVESHGPPEA
ncbi:dual specificity phosphatase Yvh1 [Venturia nashicola]|nr:dual specificity phosphatase Yvh1 [Venturia nashicola]